MKPNHDPHNQENNNRARRLVFGMLFALMVIGFLMFYITICSTSV